MQYQQTDITQGNKVLVTPLTDSAEQSLKWATWGSNVMEANRFYDEHPDKGKGHFVDLYNDGKVICGIRLDNDPDFQLQGIQWGIEEMNDLIMQKSFNTLTTQFYATCYVDVENCPALIVFSWGFGNGRDFRMEFESACTRDIAIEKLRKAFCPEQKERFVRRHGFTETVRDYKAEKIITPMMIRMMFPEVAIRLTPSSLTVREYYKHVVGTEFKIGESERYLAANGKPDPLTKGNEA